MVESSAAALKSLLSDNLGTKGVGGALGEFCRSFSGKSEAKDLFTTL